MRIALTAIALSLLAAPVASAQEFEAAQRDRVFAAAKVCRALIESGSAASSLDLTAAGFTRGSPIDWDWSSPEGVVAAATAPAEGPAQCSVMFPSRASLAAAEATLVGWMVENGYTVAPGQDFTDIVTGLTSTSHTNVWVVQPGMYRLDVGPPLP